MVSESAALAARQLVKKFPSAAGELTVLDGLSLEVRRGELAAITGPSGSGKTTLLYLLAGLDRPTAGEVLFDDRPLHALRHDELAAHRNSRVGFVWQLSNLLPDFTARENVMLPRLCRGDSQADAARAADRWLGEVGLSDRAGHLAGELSGGEQQRVALARALVTEPKVLLADEPTGNLDEAAAEQIFSLLLRLHRAHGLTSLLATHNLAMAARCDRRWRLEHGRLAAATGAEG
jgi:lipoprotein-releasing system ATP-binding protein